MKRLFTTVSGCALNLALAGAILTAPVLVAPVLAADAKPADAKPQNMKLKGTISRWDDATKSFSVKDESGKETSFAWDASTKVEAGDKRAGEPIELAYMTGADGKNMALKIRIGKEAIESHARKDMSKKPGSR